MGKVIFLCDEASSMGANMACIDDAIDKGRGYGMNLVLVYQSRGQLATCFPKDGGQTLLSNVTQIYFGTNDTNTAQEISKRLGDQTILVESETSGMSYSSQTGMHASTSRSGSTGTNTNQVGRNLMKPEEILGLDERIAIVFCQGMSPLWTRLDRYYEGRVGPPRFQGFKILVSAFCWLVTATLLAITATSFIRSYG